MSRMATYTIPLDPDDGGYTVVGTRPVWVRHRE